MTEKKSADSPKDHGDHNANGPSHKISVATCKGIANVTQFFVITCALAGFIIVFYLCLQKLRHRHVLESKETVPMNEAWFKFAVCLRPFMTPSLLNLFYRRHKRYSDIKNFTAYLESLMDVSWRPTAWLDDSLRPEEYKKYFQKVHPWNRISPRELWDFRYVYFQRAFQEFKINKKKMAQQHFRGISSGNDAIDNGYTVLKSPGSVEQFNITQPANLLFGDYNFSPTYAACLNISVIEDMSKRQMEINIKFRGHIEGDSGDAVQGTGKDTPQISLFEAVDLFVYDAHEYFTEFPVVHQFTKYSIRAHSLERLFVKGSRYYRSNTEHCRGHRDYSQTNCRHWCVIRALFDNITCTLPWMVPIQRKPWISKDHKALRECSSADEFITTLDVQTQFLYSKGGRPPEPVHRCFRECPDGCTSYKVQLLSLGSKSIGSNYGISLTVSPEVDTVNTHFDYQVLTMVAELSASISFLLGLSAIAIYDWVMTFAVWAAIKLRLYRPPAEPPDRDQSGDEDSEAGLKPGASDSARHLAATPAKSPGSPAVPPSPESAAEQA